jgi:UDP-N-acetylmuramoyl-tripeptide--D-alanyl-D-alanine ligase
MRISASEVARITNGRLVGADAIAHGISFDTRTLLSGHAFVALIGERDGHDHLEAAAQAGAVFALVSAGRAVPFLPCVEVVDTVGALGQIAHDCRFRLAPTVQNRVIGITGSAGKTSTKNMVFAVLSSQWARTHAATASLNNDIGLPVTIMNAPDACEALVLEMGMRGFGEIRRLCDIAQPTVSVVTNVGDAHSERVNGIDGVAQAKSEIVAALSVDGVAVLNADDERVRAMSSLANGQVITFGTASDADVRVDLVSTDESGIVTAAFYFAGSSHVGVIPLPGVHMMLNAAAAVAVGITCGVSLPDAVSALENTVSEAGRMQWHTVETGLRVIDDSYNANTSSMMAALKVLTGVHASQRIAVLGQMAEITHPEESHRSVAQYCRENNIELLALETDMYGTDALSVDEVIERVSGNTDTVVLVKGSRAARTERVVDSLLT